MSVSPFDESRISCANCPGEVLVLSPRRLLASLVVVGAYLALLSLAVPACDASDAGSCLAGLRVGEPAAAATATALVLGLGLGLGVGTRAQSKARGPAHASITGWHRTHTTLVSFCSQERKERACGCGLQVRAITSIGGRAAERSFGRPIGFL